MIDLSAYVSVPQAARELAVHPETVRRLLREDMIPGSKVGTLWFIAKEDLSRFKATYKSHLRHKSTSRSSHAH